MAPNRTMASLDSSSGSSLITGLAHVNLVVPQGTLHLATEFYGTTLGLTPRAVPQLQKGQLAWYDIADSGQQVHVAFGVPSDFEKKSSRHPCFKLRSSKALCELRQRVWNHFERGGEAAPKEADKPGSASPGEFMGFALFLVFRQISFSTIRCESCQAP